MPYARKARLTSSYKTDPMRLQPRCELPHIFHMVVYYLWSRDDGCWCPGGESAPGRLQPSWWRKSIGLLQESSALWRCSEFAQNADIFSAKIREVTHSIWIYMYIYIWHISRIMNQWIVPLNARYSYGSVNKLYVLFSFLAWGSHSWPISIIMNE